MPATLKFEYDAMHQSGGWHEWCWTAGLAPEAGIQVGWLVGWGMVSWVHYPGLGQHVCTILLPRRRLLQQAHYGMSLGPACRVGAVWDGAGTCAQYELAA
jgi:hypothetical protein